MFFVHIPITFQLANALRQALANGVKLYTFDVRMSETAVRSTEWFPVKPGTDSAILLAMTYHILNQNLVPAKGKEFIEKFSNVSVEELKKHVNEKGYSPEWASKVSGVPAAKISEIAELYAQDATCGDHDVSWIGCTL